MLLPYANLQLKHQNPGASMPLILPVVLICNTSDDEIHENIRVNSHARGNWLKSQAAHDGVAVLCGSGPSLADSLDEVRAGQQKGGRVFAMNGAAKYLSDYGILPDYQVMIDARPQTAHLGGPANKHLFASQVHPDCFKKVPDAQLWHLQVENIDDFLPDYDDEFVMIGGAASVGNTAICLAYAMGYRNLQIYGYDSCHKDGSGHAFHQAINDGDPCAEVLYNGKTYTASLTMKLQAEKFQETARHLQELGCHIDVHGYGLLPDMFNTPIEQLTEAEKYERMWSYDGYRIVSPGEMVVEKYLELVDPVSMVIDFGCGTGRAAIRMHDHGLPVLLLDFTTNSRDRAAMHLPFRQHDLLDPLPVKAFNGFCADVMEHIAPENVDRVIRNIMNAAGKVFFQISTIPDISGSVIAQKLHLTVKPHEWWRDKFMGFGYKVEWEEKDSIASMFIIAKEAKCQ